MTVMTRPLHARCVFNARARELISLGGDFRVKFGQIRRANKHA